MQSDFHNVPRINGVPQKYGAKFKAGNALFDRERMNFSVDVAGAYDSAGMDQWIRSFTLHPDGSGLVIKDNFKLNEVITNNQYNFMCAHRPDFSQPGNVYFMVSEERLVLQYDPAVFIAEAESMQMTDSRLSNVWGPEIYRLRLKAKKKPGNGSYIFKIKTTK